MNWPKQLPVDQSLVDIVSGLLKRFAGEHLAQFLIKVRHGVIADNRLDPVALSDQVQIDGASGDSLMQDEAIENIHQRCTHSIDPGGIFDPAGKRRANSRQLLDQVGLNALQVGTGFDLGELTGKSLALAISGLRRRFKLLTQFPPFRGQQPPAR